MRSPHQPGANYFSSGVQPGPRLGSFPFSLLPFFSPSLPFLFWGVAKASVYFNMTRKTDAGHSCMSVQSDKDLMGGKCGLLIRCGFLERQNGYDDSNSWQEFERKFKCCSIFGSGYLYLSLTVLL